MLRLFAYLKEIRLFHLHLFLYTAEMAVYFEFNIAFNIL